MKREFTAKEEVYIARKDSNRLSLAEGADATLCG